MPRLIVYLAPKLIRQPIGLQCTDTMTVKGIRTIQLWEYDLFQYLCSYLYISKALFFQAVSFSGKLNGADFDIIGQHGLPPAIQDSTASPSVWEAKEFDFPLWIGRAVYNP